MDVSLLKAQLKIDEGFKLKVYKDTAGKSTIGCGRNLDDSGITAVEAEFLLTNDIQRVQRDLNSAIPWWILLSDSRQLVIANMCFNLGVNRLLGFKDMLAACRTGDYTKAAAEILDSKAAREAPKRYYRLSVMMEHG